MKIEFYPNPTRIHFMGKKKKENTDNVILLNPPENKALGPVTFTPWQYQQAQRKGIPVQEFARRDAIVHQEAAKATFPIGAVVYPQLKSRYEEYGACKVLGIASSYADFNEEGDKWPASDIPMVVHAAPLKTGVHPINATAKFFQREVPK